MLTRAERHHYHTLLDAATLTAADASAPAIIYVQTGQADQQITRADFRARTAQTAAALAALGVAPRDLVIIAHTQNLESIYAFWGALRLGAVPSMFPTLTEKLDPALYRQNMAALVAHSGARVVLTSDAFAPELAGVVGCTVLGSSALHAAGQAATSVDHAPAAQEIAFLQHSSGTTGLQKGVALSHTAVLNQLANYADSLALTPADVVVSWLPLYHDMGLIAGFLLPLVQGIPLVLMSPFDWVSHPALLFRAIHTHGGTLCWLPNFAYNHCARRVRDRDIEGLSLATLRAFVNCSEPVHADSHHLFAERFAAIGMTPQKLAVSYAMAENVFAVTQTPPGIPPPMDTVDRHALEDARRAVPVTAEHPGAVVRVSCGRAIPGTHVQVLSPDGTLLPERSVGELAIKSDCLLTGYYNRDDLQPFTPEGWYLTGDMGYLADEEVYVIGRKKDLIINGGKNLYPQDLEALVNTVPGVHPGRAVVFGVPDEREGTELIAVIAEVDAPDDEAAHKQIMTAIRQVIVRGAGVTATYVQLVDEKWLIKTSSGKIARAANREKWLTARQE